MIDRQKDISGLLFSKKEVQRAGETLILDDIWEKDLKSFMQSMEVLSNWRSSHAYSLEYIVGMLHEESFKIDKSTIVAKRLKRTPSIVNKLHRFKSMKLRNMQDIAGCRAIVQTEKHVKKLNSALKKRGIFKVDDYIKKPKEDGYRGIHLVCKCTGENGLINYPVEIQIRTRIQHAWATALEIVDIFEDHALKTKYYREGKTYSKDWLEFFKCISDEFDILESGIGGFNRESLRSTISLIKKLKVHEKFAAYSQSAKLIVPHLEEHKDGYCLIKIDLIKKEINIVVYNKDSFDIGVEDYRKEEVLAASTSDNIVAFVATESVGNIQKAYPNYFADTEFFIKNIKKIESIYKDLKPTGVIANYLDKLMKDIAKTR
jgi:ppGpp synthetase/RelA/SpoT-type nucleotidyltranferase